MYDPPVFFAEDCVVTHAHTEIECSTVEGAGNDLQWFLLIGNQISESPSTDYAPPKLTQIVGTGSKDAATEGGDTVTLVGRNFGPSTSLLDQVTYGPSGREYEAQSCAVLNHTTVQCTTVPGVGRRHRWIVTVEDQSSDPADSPSTSYAAPEI